MKYLKTYEERKGYEYLSDEDFETLEEHFEPIIIKIINDKIQYLTIEDYFKYAFSYRPMIENFFDNEFFNELYSYSRNNFDNPKTPKIHNSFSILLDNVIRYNNIYMTMANKLVEIFKENPQNYIENYEMYEDEVSTYVKDKLKWILDAKKYNL